MVGFLLIAIAAVLWVFGAGDFATAGIIAFGVLGLVLVAIFGRSEAPARRLREEG
jgi:multisubunit Na+/H+ antiporter MnhE subunit